MNNTNNQQSTDAQQSDARARGYNTTPGQIKAMVSYFENNRSHFNVIIGRATAGTTPSKASIFQAMFASLNSDGIIPTWTSYRTVEGRWNRLVAKYNEVSRTSSTTGFGIDASDIARGILTVEEKLESLCCCFERLAVLYGERQNTHPYRVSSRGNPDGPTYQYGSQTIAAAVEAPREDTSVASAEAQRQHVFQQQEAALAELNEMMGNEDHAEPAENASAVAASTAPVAEERVPFVAPSVSSGSTTSTRPANTASRPRVDPENPSRNKRMKKDFSSEYREAQREKNAILQSGNIRAHHLGKVNAALDALRFGSFGPNVTWREAMRRVNIMDAMCHAPVSEGDLNPSGDEDDAGIEGFDEFFEDDADEEYGEGDASDDSPGDI